LTGKFDALGAITSELGRKGNMMINSKKVKATLLLLRPELPFAAGVCVVLGELTALGSFPPFPSVLLGFVWGFFLSGSAMILNDYFDIEVDRVNAPHRPLPSGLISPATAIILTIITTLIGLVSSLLISQAAVLLYIFFWVVGLLYNWKLKEMGLLGNLMVSSSVAITFILGGSIVGEQWNIAVWILSLMVFFINLGEEIAADAMDIEGDIMRDVRSLALLIGRKKALRISVLLFVLAIALSFLPAYWNLLGPSYLILISTTDLVILFFGIKLLNSKTTKSGKFFIRGVYLSALFGMLLIIASNIFV